jgi:hypothetical protein
MMIKTRITLQALKTEDYSLEVYMYASLATHWFRFLVPSRTKNRGVVLPCGLGTQRGIGRIGHTGVELSE